MDIVEKLNKSDDKFEYINALSIDKLEKVLVYASDKYYNEEPVISDSMFDMIRDFLQLKSPKSKVLKQIGASVKSKDKVPLPYYLGSMDKIKPPSNKLNSWIKKYSAPYVMTDKLDGVSGLLVYNNKNINLYTRGTATEGMDITPLLRYIKNIPPYDNVMKYFGNIKTVAFRGELIISQSRFEKNWAATLKNARNAVAGLVNSKNINPDLARDTHFVVYQIVDPLYCMTDQLKIIKEIGFDIVSSKVSDELNFEKLSKYLLKRRADSKYVIDGIIITNDDINPINIDGNPEYAWAFKDVLEDQKALSTIIDVEWNITKDGYIVPTIIIEPVDVGGVTIKRITGNNAKNMVDNMLGIGAKVEIIRSNDVIPKIEKVIKGAKVDLPKGNWEWIKSGVHIISKDIQTNDILIKNIYYFFSTLGAMGLGEKIIEKLYNGGHTTILDILKITVDDIVKIDGFKQKSAENIVESIRKYTTKIPLYILMQASNKLGRGMGAERSKDVLEKYPNIMNDYMKYTENEFINMLKEIDGWEEKTSRMFATNFKHFIEFYNSIKKYISVDVKVAVKQTGKLTGMKIVMSGFRDKMIGEYITNNGGEISSGISKNTSILIIKDESVMGTAKVIKAKELGIMIHTIESFNKEFN